MPPLSPLSVVSSADFVLLGALSMVVMAGVAWLDARLSRAGSPARAWAEAVDHRASAWMFGWLRLGLAAFLAAAVMFFGPNPVWLTPELNASSFWVAPLQIGIAISLLSRRSTWVGAVGIAMLYAGAVAAYGWFHLLDYPIFLAAAAGVAIDSFWRGRRNDVALAVLRLGTGVTLMWAGAEKWLYPWWSDDVLNHQLLAVRGGLSTSFFMCGAGWVEFRAAYALVFGRQGAQVAAWALLLPFLAAIPFFGPVDAIGHAPIVAVLVVLGSTRTRLPGWLLDTGALRRGITCACAALASIGIYWGLQALAYRRLDGIDPGLVAAAGLLTVPFLLWRLPRLSDQLAALQRDR